MTNPSQRNDAVKPSRGAKGEQTRQRILAAAEQLFAHLGFAETRMEDVAQQVGIRRPSLIYYFKDKQELYDAVKTDIYLDLHNQTVARIPAEAAALAKLDSLFDSWLDFMTARPSAALIVLRNTIERRMPRQPQQARFSESVVRSFEEIVREGQRSGEFGQVDAVQLLMLIGNGILNFVCSGPAIGAGRAFDPAAPARAENYRAMLHKTLRALVLPQTDR